MTYDQECLNLATNFLWDHPDLRGRETKLAEHIQSEIEDWIDGEYNRPSKADDSGFGRAVENQRRREP